MFERNTRMFIAVWALGLIMESSTVLAQCMNTISVEFVIYEGCHLTESHTEDWISVGTLGKR